jgi:hypothetical protein
MGTRPLDNSSRACIHTFLVQSGATITKGYPVALGTLASEIVNGGANGKGVGIALSSSSTAGEAVDVAMFGPIVPVKVGTGGATHGEHAIQTADGFTNQTLGGGTTVKYIAGVFMETGVAGDFVGLMVGRFASGAA